MVCHMHIHSLIIIFHVSFSVVKLLLICVICPFCFCLSASPPAEVPVPEPPADENIPEEDDG